MKFATGLAAPLLIVSVVSVNDATAQYMYLDTNGDGLWSGADTLVVPGRTAVDIWLRTDHNRDGSAATCAAGQQLTLNSYAFELEAVDGTVGWGTYHNNLTVLGTNLGEESTPTIHRAAFGGTTVLSAGTYKLVECSPLRLDTHGA